MRVKAREHFICSLLLREGPLQGVNWRRAHGGSPFRKQPADVGTHKSPTDVAGAQPKTAKMWLRRLGPPTAFNLRRTIFKRISGPCTTFTRFVTTVVAGIISAGVLEPPGRALVVALSCVRWVSVVALCVRCESFISRGHGERSVAASSAVVWQPPL